MRKNTLLLLFILALVQTGHSQITYNSFAGILSTGSKKIPAIENNYRIIEKTVYEMLFRDGASASSSFDYYLYGNRTYRATAFPDETRKIARLNLKVYELADGSWKMYKEASTYGSSAEVKIDTKKGAYYRFEISCTFMKTTDKYARYGVFIDREL